MCGTDEPAEARCRVASPLEGARRTLRPSDRRVLWRVGPIAASGPGFRTRRVLPVAEDLDLLGESVDGGGPFTSSTGAGRCRLGEVVELAGRPRLSFDLAEVSTQRCHVLGVAVLLAEVVPLD